ncbi:calcium-binding protein [Phaeobacter marinintestinus]|uniref:calcium-binding protein n=1 Tax=Falsiphaeobacter marinintestinus TaxID=1492905 RepID=UPI0011B4AEFA|nr:calcium-binding protein [Phaeobacter marinintestinus]
MAFSFSGLPAIFVGTENSDTFSLLDGDGLAWIFGFASDEDFVEIDGVIVNPDPPYTGILLFEFLGNTIIQYGEDDYAILWGVDLDDWIADTPPVVVDGSGNADVIDAAYVDLDGDMITDKGQIILGEGGNDIIHDGAGADEVHGGSGSDMFFSGGGADQYFGGTGSDSVLYTGSAIGLTIDLSDTANSTGIAAGDAYTDIKAVHGSDFADIIIAGAGVSNIHGEDGDDVITDGAGTQRLYGGSGGDVFQLIDGDGAQDRIMDFELGVDQLDLSLWGVTSLSEAGLVIAEHVNGGGVGQGFVKVSYNGNEVRIDGLVQADVASLTSSSFIFASLDFAGATINGTSGSDLIDASFIDADGEKIWSGGQTILGEDGADIIHDGSGDDIVDGGAGNDLFYGGDGADQYFGGTGSNSILYSNATAGLVIDMTNTANSTGIATGDSYTDVKFAYGSDYGDIITANADITRVYGEDGDDVITDAAGTQRLYGGDGSDVFQFIDGDGAQDRIMDFELGVDTLDLSLWGVTSLSDPGLTIAEQVNGSGVGQGFVKVSYNGNEIRIDGLVQADVASLTSGDFLFA